MTFTDNEEVSVLNWHQHRAAAMWQAADYTLMADNATAYRYRRPE